MAGKGTFGAFAQAQGIGTQISDNLRAAEQAGFQYREEDRIRKDRKTAELKELASQMGVHMDKLNFEATEVKSIDAPLYEFYAGAKEQVASLYDNLTKNPDDFASRIKLEKIMSSAKLMGGFTQKYAQWQKDYQEGIKTGKYSEYLNKDYPTKINEQLLQGQYKMLLDKNGDVQLMVDLDNDGKLDKEYANINVAEFLRGNSNYNPLEKADRYAIQDNIASRFGTLEKKEDAKGFMEIEYKGFDPAKTNDLRKEVDTMLGTSAKNMSNQAKSILADDLKRNPEDMTDEDFADFRAEFANEILNKFNTSQSAKKDYEAQYGGERIALAKRGQALDEAKFQWTKEQAEIARAAGLENDDKAPKSFLTLNVDHTGKPVVTKTKTGFSYAVPKENAPVVGDKTVRNVILDPETNAVKLRVAQTVTEYQRVNGEIKPIKTEKISVISDPEEVGNFVKQIDNPYTKGKFTDQQEVSAYLVDYYNNKVKNLTSPTDEIEGDISQL
jgi:hypothetical protein